MPVLAAMLLNPIKYVIAVVAVFVVSIVVHEFGHFITAKKFGVSVPAFAIGFGPKLLKRQYRGTEFSIRLFPIGGLVQLSGEIPQDALFRKGEQIAFELDHTGRICKVGDPADFPSLPSGTLVDLDLMDRMSMTIEDDTGRQTYRVIPHAQLMTSVRNSIPLVERSEQVVGKPLWQRAIIILAGPVMNFLLAGVLFSLFYMHSGIPLNTPTLGQIVQNSPAAAAGLKQGDIVTAVNGHKVHSWVDLVIQIQSDKSKPPKPLVLNIDRQGNAQNITVTPRMTSQGIPQLGINEAVSYNSGKAITSGFQSVYYGSVNAVQMYGQVIRHHEFQNLAGPVGIADVIVQQAQTGIWQVVMIAGLLSLNLGLFNLIPIPALDGGRLLFMIVEMFRGKSVDPRKEGLVHFVGFALLMLFAVVITYRDVTRLF